MGQIQYSEKYFDDTFKYRHVVLPLRSCFRRIVFYQREQVGGSLENTLLNLYCVKLVAFMDQWKLQIVWHQCCIGDSDGLSSNSFKLKLKKLCASDLLACSSSTRSCEAASEESSSI
ncbi:hypothetical protein L6452_09581 [Arctium lappa]|uniref:Uncharacterized protein n=1 Tax=Arctium lappa TaxID=4217 RepID=A0ACB9DKF4_ARCLA|nr:hypothetical protein L6452_09581 [Arctium lappa]